MGLGFNKIKVGSALLQYVCSMSQLYLHTTNETGILVMPHSICVYVLKHTVWSVLIVTG